MAWQCICDCGNETTASTQLLQDGRTRSCGCLARELSAERGKARGMRAAIDGWVARSAAIPPEERERRRIAAQRSNAARHAEQLTDWYVKKVLSRHGPLSFLDVPDVLVNLKREQMACTRLAKEMQQAAIEALKGESE